MKPHTAQVQAAVQQLLLEHGEYVPLELLLATNRLAYEDYRAWREGRLETLDAVLADGQRESCAWLEAAQSWACALALTAEPAVHHGWAENAGTGLVASADPRLNALLSTRFRHIREHDQLDLFIDSAQTAAVNTLVDALTARNVSEARGALDRLVRINRDHGQRFHAAKLISALEAPAPEGPEQGFDRFERMEREWVPAASALLGARRRDFLSPLWRNIGRALDPAPFEPGNPQRHASRAYREGLDWERMRRSVLAVPGHENVPVLLARLAEAHWRLRERARAIETWFALCRLAPELFEKMIEAPDFLDWARRTGAGCGARSNARVVSGLDAARGARARRRARPAPRRRRAIARLRPGDRVAEPSGRRCTGNRAPPLAPGHPYGPAGAISGEAGSRHRGSTVSRVPER
ncbi:MAG: hypothetical protein J4G15_16400 [Alphaproteobacteria bacterium]|nr:hypothetical protein [Alphaproteobacteria bacterium]